MKTILLIFINFLISISVSATTCTNKANEKIYKALVKDSRVIFLGKAISIGESDTISTPVTFQALKSWKGVDAEKITINYVHDSTVDNSVLIPKVGAPEIVYADRNVIGKVFSSYCQKVENSERRLKRELGEGKVFEQPQPQPTQQTENSEGIIANIWKRIVSFLS